MPDLRAALHTWERGRSTPVQFVREKAFATGWLDSGEIDIYQIHQKVWDLVCQHSDARHPEFQFRVDEATGLTTIRSRFLRSGSFVRQGIIPEGDKVRVLVSLKAVKQINGSERDLGLDQAKELAIRLLQQSGLSIDRPQDFDLKLTRARGFKQKKQGLLGDVHCIDFACAHVDAVCTIADRNQLIQAWMHGIGRGKRFGLGMITFH